MLVFLRALLGVSEAAFGPGVPYYLSFFFNREELAFRTGLFISAAPLSTAFASTLAWLIVQAGDHSVIAAWRLLFLVEGFPSVIVAVFAWYHIPDSPEKARFLSVREKNIARLRLSEEPLHKRESTRKGLQWAEIGWTIMDPKSYITAVHKCGCRVVFELTRV